MNVVSVGRDLGAQPAQSEEINQDIIVEENDGISELEKAKPIINSKIKESIEFND
jgi:hypothetical protein